MNHDRSKIMDSTSSVGPTKRPGYIYAATILSAVGGFLFGYDTGVVSGAMLLLRTEFSLDTTWQELIISITIVGAWAFALVAGFTTDFFGRKPVILVASFIFTAGAIIMGVANEKVTLLGGRLVVGAGIGLASMSVPLYIAEVAPTDIRGSLVTLNNLCVTFGQFVACVVDGAFSTDKINGWRYMLGLAGIPSFIQFFGFLVMPESPRWLISHGKYDEAIVVLQKTRGATVNVEEEYNAIKDSCLELERERKSAASSGPIILQVLRNPPIRRALIIGCLLQIFQQIAGINTVMYYSAIIIEMSGVHDKTKAIWMTAATSGVNFVCCLIGTFMVERVGRRKLLLSSFIGVIISLIVLAIGFQLAANNSPGINILDEGSHNTSCYLINTCDACINNKECGFCFDNVLDKNFNGTCTFANSEFPDEALIGRCSNSSLPPPLLFAYNWCPNDYSWIVFMGLMLYLVFFSPGLGSMPWTINSEIYPLWARSTCFSVSTACNWLFNLIISMTFLTLTETITKYGAFWLYAVFAVIGFVVFFFLLPETKGRTLEEMESLFAHSWWQNGKAKQDKNIVQPAVIMTKFTAQYQSFSTS